MSLIVLASSPGVTLQDEGRPGWLAQGLSRGGAADSVALAEGAALLAQPTGLAVVELANGPARFRTAKPLRIALTGAPFRATLREGGKDRPLSWNTSHALPPGAELSLSPAEGGFAYLAPAGGIEAPLVLGGRSAHLAAGIGRALKPEDELTLGPDPGGSVDMVLEPVPRFGGGEVRVVESLQTSAFPPEQVERFRCTTFRRDPRGNRMGVRLNPEDGMGFEAPGGLSILSEIVQPGDIQITGDGTPFVLLCECQTTGGYPRIATVLPCDLPRIAQAPPGVALSFRFVTRAEGRAAMADHARVLTSLRDSLRPRLRDPAAMADLLSHNLIGGVVSAHHHEDAP